MKKYLEDLKPEEVIARLKQGEILKSEDGKITYECIDGIIVGKTEESFAICPSVGSYMSIDKLYFDMPEPELKIEVGKFYQTRGGKRAYVFAQNSEGKYNVAIEGGEAYSVFNGGYYSEEEETDKDLLEKEKTHSGAKKNTELYEDIHNLILKRKSIGEMASLLGKHYKTVHQYIFNHKELHELYKNG